MKKLLFFLLIGILSQAQDLTGRWVIYGNMDSGYYAELNLIQNQKNIYAGHSYDTENQGFCRHFVEAKFNPDTQTFTGKDVELIDKSAGHEATDYHLHYYTENGKEFLMGTQTITPIEDKRGLGNPFEHLFKMRGFNFPHEKNMVVYVKVDDKYTVYTLGAPNTMTEEEMKLQKSEFPELNESSASEGNNEKTSSQREGKNKEFSLPEVIDNSIFEKKKERNNRLLAHITLKDIEEVTLLIRDYGEEDNDTVSIFLNNRLLAGNVRITHESKEYQFKLNLKENNKLVFVANNLGDIPPNTARITIIAGKRRYNYRLFTDEKNNAVIRLENK
ncbi:Uncharacterised protein [Candidatus Ornithobacterium hominis]|uniref:hypothetical protein n=1 Tax=Candidatus Ornithobacterium hominis TaxID=2497989 RepID=UPI000E5A1DF7|nr:hypothetical protein [Candidatus Ornithobacterium hominis]SZD73717.1 Uncharacterised protein [Candidatus Ornithobacterium hominis]